jgi:hypothetical protein
MTTTQNTTGQELTYADACIRADALHSAWMKLAADPGDAYDAAKAAYLAASADARAAREREAAARRCK